MVNAVRYLLGDEGVDNPAKRYVIEVARATHILPVIGEEVGGMEEEEEEDRNDLSPLLLENKKTENKKKSSVEKIENKKTEKVPRREKDGK